MPRRTIATDLEYLLSPYKEQMKILDENKDKIRSPAKSAAMGVWDTASEFGEKVGDKAAPYDYAIMDFLKSYFSPILPNSDKDDSESKPSPTFSPPAEKAYGGMVQGGNNKPQEQNLGDALANIIIANQAPKQQEQKQEQPKAKQSNQSLDAIRLGEMAMNMSDEEKKAFYRSLFK